MATDFSSTDSGSERGNSSRALATLLGVYAALYLAVVGAIHFASSPDASAAVVAEVTSLHVGITTLPAEPIGSVGGVSGAAPIDPEGADDSRECIDGIDTSCIYN